MALDFPNSPSDGQVYTDPSTNEQWVYEAATNSWTSKGLVNTGGGLVYKGTVDITAAPPAASSGWQYSVLADGTANAGFGPGITGTVSKGDIIMYTGTGWTDTSSNVPQATAAVAGIDKKLWRKTGTALAPETAADTVQISAGTAALPGLTPVGDPNTGVFSAGADQIGLATKGTGRLFIDDNGNVGININNPSETLEVAGNAILDTNDATLRIKQGTTGTRGAIDFTLGGDSTAYGSLNLDYDQRTTQGLRLSTSYPLTLECGGSTKVIFKRSTTETARFSEFGSLLIGASNSVNTSNVAAGIQLHSTTTSNGASLSLARFNNDSSGPILTLAKSRNAVIAAGAIVLDNDELGRLNFSADDGTDMSTASARIQSFVDGTTGAKDIPGRLVFSVTAAGSASPVEAMRIKNSRIINIANTPVYADNTAAKAGGLVAGDIYRKADGTLMITF